VVVVRNGKQLLALFASEWHGVLDDAPERLEPVVVALARKWQVVSDHIVYDKASLGRSFGSYLANHGLDVATGYFGAGKGGNYLGIGRDREDRGRNHETHETHERRQSKHLNSSSFRVFRAFRG
jgi:hypothetical protein